MPNLSVETILAGVAAVAVLFWPQISNAAKSMLAAWRQHRPAHTRPDAVDEMPTKTRAVWVTELMELHDLLVAAGEDDLGKLCCDLCNGLICVIPADAAPANPPAVFADDSSPKPGKK